MSGNAVTFLEDALIPLRLAQLRMSLDVRGKAAPETLQKLDEILTAVHVLIDEIEANRKMGSK